MTKGMITINGKKYTAKELDFNFLCILGEQGIEISEISKKILPTMRAYVAYCMNTDMDIAGSEINNHIINGGSFEELADIFNEKAEESDFFRALQKATTEESPKKRTKKSEAEVSE